MTYDKQRIAQLEAIIKRQEFVEDRYEELHVAARRCLRYHGVDAEMHNAAMRAMDTLIQRHIAEINEMESGE